MHQVAPARAPHKGKCEWLAGGYALAAKGGHHVYESEMRRLKAWILNKHFCPTKVPALLSAQT